MTKTKKPGGRWYRIVREGAAPIYMKQDRPFDCERMNSLQDEFTPTARKYLTADLLNREEVQALELCEWERKQTHALFEEVLKHVNAGHYNEELKSRVIHAVKCEYRYSDMLVSLVKALEALPPRTICGTVEAWCASALNNFVGQRMNQLNEKEDIFKRIEQRFFEDATRALPDAKAEQGKDGGGE